MGTLKTETAANVAIKTAPQRYSHLARGFILGLWLDSFPDSCCLDFSSLLQQFIFIRIPDERLRNDEQVIQDL